MPKLVFDIHRFKEVDSTNSVLKEMALKGAAPGTVVVAIKQTQGRGRAKKSWNSPVGGLYFSLLVSAPDPKRITDLPLLMGVVVAQSISELLPKSCEVSVKWPNDVLVNFRKVAGILCETIGDSGLAVLGVGININTPDEDLAPFQNNPFKATSFAKEVGAAGFEVEPILQVLLKKFSFLFGTYAAEGFETVKFLWEKNCRMIGKRVEFREHPVDGAEEARYVGQFVGIDPNGAFVLARSPSDMVRFYSGEITCYWPST